MKMERHMRVPPGTAGSVGVALICKAVSPVNWRKLEIIDTSRKGVSRRERMEDGNPILTLLYFAFLREIQTVHKAQLMLWKGGKMASCYLLSSKRKWGEPGVPLGGTEKWNRQEGAAVFQTTADSNLRIGNPPQPDPFLKKAVASLLTERSCRQPQLGSD